MSDYKSKLIPFPNPLEELPPPPDDWFDYRFADARRAIWRLLDTTAATVIALTDQLTDSPTGDFDEIAGELREAYHVNLLIIREALDNHKTGRCKLQSRR